MCEIQTNEMEKLKNLLCALFSKSMVQHYKKNLDLVSFKLSCSQQNRFQLKCYPSLKVPHYARP